MNKLDIKEFDVIIIGGGPAGLMCAWQAALRGRSVCILERGRRVGGKIFISGGGKCNFTNLHCDASQYISQNSHFVKSALARFTPFDFIHLLNEHHIEFEEREHGRLFCTDTAGQIVTMLHRLNYKENVGMVFNCQVDHVKQLDDHFQVVTSAGEFTAGSLVVATGGTAWPQAGATDFGYTLARQFGLSVLPQRPGLVPLTYSAQNAFLGELAGISLRAAVSHSGFSFTDQLLFAHHFLTGPAVLQVSCTWRKGENILINWLPDIDLMKLLITEKQSRGQLLLSRILGPLLPNRFLKFWFTRFIQDLPLAQCSVEQLEQVVRVLQYWEFLPGGNEGLKKAETTIGGVDTHCLSSKTMESARVKGLYFIGEVVDVAGRLGGYNLQWAWSSGFAAGQFV